MLTKHFSIYFRLTRPFSLIFPIITVASFSYISYRLSSDLVNLNIFSWLMYTLLAAISTIPFTAASNSFNQVYDIEIDRIVKANRPLPRGEISLTHALNFSYTCFILGFLIFAMAVQGRIMPLLIILTGVFATISYSIPSLRLKRYLWPANFIMALTKSLVLILSAWLVSSFNLNMSDPWVLGGILFLYFLGATSTKDFSDIEGDRKYNIVTLPIKYGPYTATKIMSFFLIGPFLLLAVIAMYQLFYPSFILLHANALAVLILAVILIIWNSYISILLIKNPFAKGRTENHPAWQHMYLIYIAFCLGLVISYSL